MTTLPADAAGERALEPHETYVHEHHWRNAEDEAEGCKFGMWLFLSTEVLLFAGFFCAYAAFRMLYYDTWRYASMDYLSWKIGLANTVVLLFSSFTVVMAIRETQLARKWRAVFFLGLTNACAIFFLVTKLALEYAPKITDGKLPGANYSYGGGGYTGKVLKEATTHDHIFLSVYWTSTATHGVHVLIGVLLLTYAMIRTAKGYYGPKNFIFTENVGLYWHIVDVIWIFLFPMLYLV